MNYVLYLKYAVEVEKTGSISKAAENLFMGQPHLSKAVRELEEHSGINIFNRTSKGIVVTPKGHDFLAHAKNILSQIEELENMYKPKADGKQSFDIAVPRASYVSYAFTEFIRTLDFDKNILLSYQETNSVKAIDNVADSVNNLAIIRYQTLYEQYFLNTLVERDLKYQEICEFEYRALMSVEHPLANKNAIEFNDLSKYIEVVHGDITIPSLPIVQARKLANKNENNHYISVYERASQLEILSKIKTSYMLVSPMPLDLLDKFSLVQKSLNISKNKYKDILIYRYGYHLTQADKIFIEKLKEIVQLVSKN